MFLCLCSSQCAKSYTYCSHIDAASSGLPDQLGLALRNAAMLDPTWDCIVWVPPGSVVSVIGSGLTKLCATKEANGTWKDFVFFRDFSAE